MQRRMSGSSGTKCEASCVARAANSLACGRLLHDAHDRRLHSDAALLPALDVGARRTPSSALPARRRRSGRGGKATQRCVVGRLGFAPCLEREMLERIARHEPVLIQ